MVLEAEEDRAVKLPLSAEAVQPFSRTDREPVAPVAALEAVPDPDGPISPELVLIDPELRTAALAALPERPWPEAPHAIVADKPLLPVPERRDDPDVARLQEMIRMQQRAILAHDPGTRLGADPENLHQLRVATRRLRAFLRVGRRLVDPE